MNEHPSATKVNDHLNLYAQISLQDIYSPATNPPLIATLPFHSVVRTSSVVSAPVQPGSTETKGS
jgi:hypothetical protein